MRSALYTVHGLRETERTGLARKITGKGSSVSSPTSKTLHTDTAGKMAVPTFIIPTRQAQWANIELALAFSPGNLGHDGPDSMVVIWYGPSLRGIIHVNVERQSFFAHVTLLNV